MKNKIVLVSLIALGLLHGNVKGSDSTASFDTTNMKLRVGLTNSEITHYEGKKKVKPSILLAELEEATTGSFLGGVMCGLLGYAITTVMASRASEDIQLPVLRGA